MSYCGYVTTLTNVRKHPNADRLLLADVFRTVVCVSLDYTEGQVGVYLPVDGQVSVEFGEKNNLLRKKDENGNNVGGYMDPEKRNIKAIALRGEKSDGLFLPLSCLDYCFEDGDASKHLSIGDTITVVNGHEICEKYIPKRAGRTSAGGAGTRAHRRAKRSIAPTFFEHADTEQLAYNQSAFKPGDEVEITLKMHGTSQRTAYVPVLQEDKFNLQDHEFKSLFLKILPKGKLRDRLIEKWCQPVYAYGDVTGTRRVVLDTYEGGFYGSNEFREQHAKVFEGKLWKGETVYYEVVGFTHTGTPIMAEVSNSKVNDKNFTKQYGKTTVFSYGCVPDGYRMLFGEDNEGVFSIPVETPQSDIYVYRMTMTNEDGEVVEYTPDFMRYRCEMMGVKTVPVLWKGTIPEYPGSSSDDTITAGEWITNVAEQFYDGPDPVGKTHIREGVVVRILNRPKFTAYKHKNFNFKVIEGIAKDTAEAPDMEEAQEMQDDN